MNNKSVPVASGILFFLIVSLVFLPIRAQECAAAIQQAIESLGDACGAAGSSSACMADGSSTPLSELETVNLMQMEADDAALKTALLNVHGNVPLALSETGLRYIAFGDVVITNEVDPDSAFTPVEGVPVTAIVASNLRSLPSTSGQVIDSVVPGTELTAYGLSNDRQWARVLHNDMGVWISRQVITTEGSLDDLPDLDGSERTLMQSFFLETGTTDSDCEAMPLDMLMIQGPENYSSVITVNGVEIDFEGTIFLRTIDDRLQLGVLTGGARSNRLPVPAGFTMFIPLDASSAVSGAWTGLRPLNGEELTALGAVQAVPESILFQPITLPTAEQIAQTIASINQASLGQTSAGPASGQADCSGLRPTSPLSTMPNNGNTPFYWDAAAGATGYRFNIYNEDGEVVRTVDLNTTNTTFQTDTTASGIGGGTLFSWNVEAMVNGEVACSSARAQVVRDAASVPVGGGGSSSPGATPTPCLWGQCD